MLESSLINRAAPPGSMRYFSVLYAPEEKQQSLYALYVIDAEIRESAQSANHDVAHTRLQWWRGEVDRLVNGNPLHPATRVLAALGGSQASYAKLHEFLAAADMDLARMTYLNARELRAYCARSGGVIQELIAERLLAPEPLSEEARAFANRIGVGVRQCEMLRDVRQDAYDGRLYLPLDQLDRHGIGIEELRAPEVAPAVKAALREFHAMAREELAPPETPQPALRPLVVLGALYRRLLDLIAARDYEVATERIELGPVEKPWVAWRAALRA
jgi:phytoene synthase